MDANADSHRDEHTDADIHTYVHANQYALSDSHASAA
jgi:hypothetical protein